MVVAILLLPRFTLTAVATFIDILRLAADDADLSRPVRIQWQLVSEAGGEVLASCGLKLGPTRVPGASESYDCLVVAGGLGNSRALLGPRGKRLVQGAISSGKKVVTLCRAAHALADMGLLKGRRVSVHWMHRRELLEIDPDILMTTESSSTVDGPFITCAGGVSGGVVADMLVADSLGAAQAHKASRILLMQPNLGIQPPSNVFPSCHNKTIQKALLYIEEKFSDPLSVGHIARHVQKSRRQLERLFRANLNSTVMEAVVHFRISAARPMLQRTELRTIDVAIECGFNSYSAFGRAYRKVRGRSPAQDRADAA